MSAPMMSYAQNGEDVVLARAFAGRPTGRYIDIGANHPTTDSVTRHFYDLGWTGINIEPQHHLHEALRRARPRDTNLHLGVGRAAGQLEFHRVPAIDGWSTFDAATAAAISAEGHEVITEVVGVETLDTIISSHMDGYEFDFLKVDVEGFEDAALGAVDWHTVRPRVLVVESGQGLSVWEERAVSMGYRRTLWDGLNVFLVRSEDEAQLGHALSYPACVRDEFDVWRYRAYILDQAELLERQVVELSALRRAVLRSRLEAGVPDGVRSAHDAVDAVRVLVEVYAARADLHAEFGDAQTCSPQQLLAWAAHAAGTTDSDAPRLAAFASWYARAAHQPA